VSTPLPIAQAFAYTEGVSKYAEIYSMVTVIDAEHFENNLISDELADNEEKQDDSKKRRRRKMKKGEEISEEDKPTLAELMLDQL
jgi:G3E family GTPase